MCAWYNDEVNYVCLTGMQPAALRCNAGCVSPYQRLIFILLALSTGRRVGGVCWDDDDVVEEGPLVDEAARGGAQVHEGDERDPAPERVHQLLAQLETQHFATFL